MGLGDGEGAGDDAGTDEAAWAGSGEGDLAAPVDTWGEAAAEGTTGAGEPETRKTSVIDLV